MEARAHRVVVVGGGFGGLQAAAPAPGAGGRDAGGPAELPPVPAAALPGGDGRALAPARSRRRCAASCARQRNVDVLLGRGRRTSTSRRGRSSPAWRRATRELAYDTLIVAAGATHAYFGHDEWAAARAGPQVARGRARAAAAHPRAPSRRPRREPDPAARARLADVRRRRRRADRRRAGGPDRRDRARTRCAHDFRRIDPREARVRAPRGRRAACSPRFPPSLRRGASAARAARRDACAPARWSTGIDARGRDGPARRRRRRSGWRRARSSGRRASRRRRSARRWPGRRARARPGGPRGRRARPHAARPPGGLRRSATWCASRWPRGQIAAPRRGAGGDAAGPLRGRGRSRARLAGQRRAAPFRYRDKGNLATIGRAKAVGEIKGLPLSGTIAWLRMALRPPLLPGRPPEPGPGLHPLDRELHHPRTRSAPDHGRGRGGGTALDEVR